MGRRRKAWVPLEGTKNAGKRTDRGQTLPGYYAEFNERVGDGVTHRSKCFSTLRNARKFVRQYNARLELRELDETLPISLNDAADEFDRDCATQTDSTKAHYSNSLGLLIGVIASIEVHRVNGAHLDRFVAARLTNTVSQATVASYVRAIGVFFNWAVRKSYAVVNPTAEMNNRPSNRGSRARPHITEQTLARIVASLDTEDRRLAAWIAMTTGLDRGAIERLAAGMIDIEGAAIRVRRDKTGKWLSVPIHASLLPLLAAKCDGAPRDARVLSGLSRQSRQRDWWKRATREAGCPEILFRDLRAVASSRLMRLGGASLVDAQRLLGHASPETTARHYHIPDPSAVRALDRIPLPGIPGPSKRQTDSA